MNLKSLMIIGCGVAGGIFCGGVARATSPVQPVELKEIEQNVESVVDMKSIEDGAIRLFKVDQNEPVARPMKLVLVLPKGEDGETGEPNWQPLSAGTYCGIELAKSNSTKKREGIWDVFTIKIPVSYYDPENGGCKHKDILNIQVKLGDSYESQAAAWTDSGNPAE